MGTSKRIAIITLLIICTLPVWAGGKNDPPDDIPTIEALISAHKVMKKAEEAALLELGAITATHEGTTGFASKYSQTRKMLNQRMADVGSVISLASSLMSLTLQVKDLTESYSDFTETTFERAKKHPFLILIYTNANLQIASEIKHITKCCVDYAGFQTNVLKSTMEEKKQLLGFITAHIASLKRLISRANMTIRSICAGRVKEYHVHDIVNSKTNKEIMNKIIKRWKG